MAEGIMKLQYSTVLQQQQQEQHHLGIILPITSRGMKSPMVDLHSYLRQISGNLKLPSGSNLYVAVDNDDAVYRRDSSAYLFKEAFCEQKVTVVTEWPAAHAAHAASSLEDSVAGAESVAPICAMLNILIKRAYEDGCDFFTMLGDDVCIDCEQQSSDNQRRNWFDLVSERTFKKLAH